MFVETKYISLQVVALQIMRANYEQLVKAHQRAPQVQEDLVPDEIKFQVSNFIIRNQI